MRPRFYLRPTPDTRVLSKDWDPLLEKEDVWRLDPSLRHPVPILVMTHLSSTIGLGEFSILCTKHILTVFCA